MQQKLGCQLDYRTSKQSLGTVQSSSTFLLKINATTVKVVHFGI